MSLHFLGFRLLGFHHRVQWRGAKTVSKECWGPCHGLIPSLWDFAQNYSPQIERRDQNWRGTIYPLDSEKAIEPCISAVTDCQPRFAQGQPNGYFQMKELDRITGVPMNERWRRLNANTSQTQYVLLCANLASHQLCRERQPLWKSHDGLNLTCLDQCHGVHFHGASTYQGWRKGIVIQSIYSLNLIHKFKSLFRRR